MASSPAKQLASQPRDTHSPSSQRREQSISSDSSDSPQVPALSVAKRSPYAQQQARPSITTQSSSSTTSLNSFSRAPPRPLHDLPLRQHSQSPALDPPSAHQIGHRPRQHSQGFFEPSLPTASSSNGSAMPNLTASQIAAQAAMHVQNAQHVRKRSQTIPDPAATVTGRRKPSSPPPPVPALNVQTHGGMQYHNGILGGHRAAATTAANVAFPRSPLHSPVLLSDNQQSGPSEKEQKPSKEKSKMKLFSKPKSIGISRDKDLDRKNPALPSPNKMGMHSTVSLPRLYNASTTSLVDPSTSATPSIYSSANASTSTLVPTDRAMTFEKEKEKHKHHFLSRQKNKLKDKEDHHNLPLSSANSNSRPTDPNAPQPLYSFAAPTSPGHSSTFAKSMSGLDLRHGGRALREKKKEEKAAASSLAPVISNSSTSLDAPFRERNQSFNGDRPEWPGPGSYGTITNSLGASIPGSTVPHTPDVGLPQATVAHLGATFGLPGMSPDDAWPLLKARLLNIFEGEDPRPPIEDFNGLVSVHIRRCIQRRAPQILVEDLTELLQTGFASLEQTLRHVPDERLVPYLVDMWLVVFSTILPFMQAVFLPLDLEFKGRGPLVTAREAAEFWGAALPESDAAAGGGPKTNVKLRTLGEELDVRRITLLTFRDTVILPRNDALMRIFSRLSLENISAGVSNDPMAETIRPGGGAAVRTSSPSPNDPYGSFNSQSSTLLATSSSTTASDVLAGAASHGRSRATSNTSARSAGSFNSNPSSHPPPLPHLSAQQHHPSPPTHAFTHPALPPLPHHHRHPQLLAQQQAMDGARVTEMVGRMLQCVSVLASVRSGDEAQSKMERLTGELKLNWLGRGRTGRQRRGFVGTKRRGVGVVA